MTDTTAGLAGMRQELALALSMLERAEVIDFNGHFSTRLPAARGLLINAAESVRSQIGADDCIEIGVDGRPLDGNRTAPMEFQLHAQIYLRRPDVQSIVHAHPLWSTVLTTAGHAWQPVTMQAAVLGPVPTFDLTASINTAALGEALAQCLAGGKAALMRRHGVVAVASSVRDAFVHAMYLEENAHRQYLALQIGEPQPLDADECAKIGANLSRPVLLQKVWDFYAARHRREHGVFANGAPAGVADKLQR